jgi:phosphopantetheinyl transferase
MPLYRSRNISCGRWAIWKCDETIEQLLALLPPDHTEYLRGSERFTSAARTYEWVAVRTLLYTMRGSLDPIRYCADGSPHFDDPNVYISISHTTGYVAVALADVPIGIDIERRHARVLRIIDRFADEAEARFIRSMSDEKAQIEAALLCWSGKESVYKCVGKRAADFRRDLHLRFCPRRHRPTSCRVSSPDGELSLRLYCVVDTDFVLTYTTYPKRPLM